MFDNVVDCDICTNKDIVQDCDTCSYNQGITQSAGRIAGPCGQQNCWFSCTVCRYNNYRYFETE